MDKAALPEEFAAGRFCEDYEFRCEASARTWARPHAQDNLLCVARASQCCAHRLGRLQISTADVPALPGCLLSLCDRYAVGSELPHANACHALPNPMRTSA